MDSKLWNLNELQTNFKRSAKGTQKEPKRNSIVFRVTDGRTVKMYSNGSRVYSPKNKMLLAAGMKMEKFSLCVEIGLAIGNAIRRFGRSDGDCLGYMAMVSVAMLSMMRLVMLLVIHWMMRSMMHSMMHSMICSMIHPMIRSMIHPMMHPMIRLLNQHRDPDDASDECL